MDLVMLANGIVGGQFRGEDLVDKKLFGQYLGTGTDGVGIALGFSDAIDMGDESAGALQGMGIVRNLATGIGKIGIAGNYRKVT